MGVVPLLVILTKWWGVFLSFVALSKSKRNLLKVTIPVEAASTGDTFGMKKGKDHFP